MREKPMKNYDLSLTPKKMGLEFKQVLQHKWYVFKACAIAGHPWIGLKHDMSKFSPQEFFERSRGQGYGVSPVEVLRDTQGYSKAWQHHKGHNPHHWEYWTNGYRENRTKTIKVPFRYILEMFCDWIGAGQTYGMDKWTPEGAREYWYGLRDKNSAIHPESVDMLNTWFDLLVEKGYKETLKSLDSYKEVY